MLLSTSPTVNIGIDFLLFLGMQVQDRWSKVLCPARHKIGHFEDSLPNQTLGLSTENTKTNNTNNTTKKQSNLKSKLTQKNTKIQTTSVSAFHSSHSLFLLPPTLPSPLNIPSLSWNSPSLQYHLESLGMQLPNSRVQINKLQNLTRQSQAADFVPGLQFAATVYDNNIKGVSTLTILWLIIAAIYFTKMIHSISKIL